MLRHEKGTSSGGAFWVLLLHAVLYEPCPGALVFDTSQGAPIHRSTVALSISAGWGHFDSRRAFCATPSGLLRY